MSSHCCLSSMLSDEIAAVHLTEEILGDLFLAAFRILSLFFISSVIICISVEHLEFILHGIC